MTSTREYNELVGRRISYLLSIRKMTQRQFAIALNYSETGMSQVIGGTKGMSKVRLVEAARILNVHPLVLTSQERIPDEQLLLLDKFLKIIAQPENHESYPAIKTLIESEGK